MSNNKINAAEITFNKARKAKKSVKEALSLAIEAYENPPLPYKEGDFITVKLRVDHFTGDMVILEAGTGTPDADTGSFYLSSLTPSIVRVSNR